MELRQSPELLSSVKALTAVEYGAPSSLAADRRAMMDRSGAPISPKQFAGWGQNEYKE